MWIRRLSFCLCCVLTASCRVCRRAESAYALQLALSALRILLASQPEDGSSRHVSYEAVMDCIQHCDDRLVQNAALSLLGLLAAAMPQQHLIRLTEVLPQISIMTRHASSSAVPEDFGWYAALKQHCDLSS